MDPVGSALIWGRGSESGGIKLREKQSLIINKVAYLLGLGTDLKIFSFFLTFKRWVEINFVILLSWNGFAFTKILWIRIRSTRIHITASRGQNLNSVLKLLFQELHCPTVAAGIKAGLEKTRVFQEKKPNPPGFYGFFYGFFGFQFLKNFFEIYWIFLRFSIEYWI